MDFRVFILVQYVDMIHYRRDKVCNKLATFGSKKIQSAAASQRFFLFQVARSPKPFPLVVVSQLVSQFYNSVHMQFGESKRQFFARKLIISQSGSYVGSLRKLQFQANWIWSEKYLDLTFLLQTEKKVQVNNKLHGKLHEYINLGY